MYYCLKKLIRQPYKLFGLLPKTTALFHFHQRDIYLVSDFFEVAIFSTLYYQETQTDPPPPAGARCKRAAMLVVRICRNYKYGFRQKSKFSTKQMSEAK